MNGKFKILLGSDEVPLEGTIKISIDVPRSTMEVAAIKGYSDQEIQNCIGQKFQEIVDILALGDGGV